MTAIVLDTETTGLSRETDRVIEVAIVWWNNDDRYLQRFNPGMHIPEDATNIHGITDEDVKDCPPFAEHAAHLRDTITKAEAVIGYNPFFDAGMIDAEMARCGLGPIRWPTIVCAKRTWDCYEPNDRNLMNAFRRFVNRDGFNAAHSAIADTQATKEVLKAQIDYFNLRGVAWEDFDPERKLWWMTSHHILIIDQTLIMNFGKWRGKPVRDVDHGFWRWLLDRDFPKHLLLLALEATKLMEKNTSRDVMDIQLYSWARAMQKGEVTP